MTPVFSDQGTRYEPAAAIADLAVLTPLAAVHPGVRAVPLDVPGLGLLPAPGEFAAAVTPAMICTVLPGSVADGTPATGTPAAAVPTGPESGWLGLLAMDLDRRRKRDGDT
ncbi:hypothetical protein ACVGVM_00940 [Pseudonocardia bannensis]|uniref:Uncharacterized protein n=1 Tax=Pseudonocardia bannensis TaxID=630973 RepID=A0A848DBZ1_9PSEU|nr:hypothetical protein [Pseudonocardia bannensis]NMH90061.1 hypothetical protein [Pseudonocardia bannensis]